MAARPSGPTSSSGCARWSTRDQVEILGGGLYEPVLASLPERDRVDQLDADGRGASRRIAGRRPRGAWLAERVWEPDLPTALVGGGLPSGRSSTTSTSARPRSPRTNLWGAYTTEDQGRCSRSSAPSRACATGSRSATVEDVIGYLRDHATEDGDAGRDDGRRRREVRRLADDLRALLGRAAAGSSGSSTRSRRTRDWLTTVTPSRVARARAADRPRLRADRRRTPRWASGRSRPTRPWCSRRLLHEARGGAPSRGALAARRRSGATSRSSTARSTTSTSRCSGRRRRSRRCRTGPSRTRAIDHLHRGQSNDCYWHGLFGGIYICAHAARDVRAPDRRRGRRRTARSGRSAMAELRTSTSTACPRCCSRTRARSWPSSRARAAGSARWDIRAARHALAAVLRRRPEAYHETLRAHEAAAAARATGRPAGDDGGRRRRRRRSTTS